MPVFLKLIRYKNLLMVLLTMVLTKYALLESYFTNTLLTHFNFIILTTAVLLITASGYIINDIFDIETDKINKPNKSFLNKEFSIKKAWSLYILLSIFGLILGIFVSFAMEIPLNSIYFIATSIILFFYSKYFKKIALIGNLIVSFLCALVIFLVYEFEFIGTNLESNSKISSDFIIAIYLVFSLTITFIREIIKDIEDVNGDLKIKASTLPILIGRKRTARIAFFISSIMFVFTLIILQSTKNTPFFFWYVLLFICLPLLYLLYKIWFARTKKNYGSISKILKFIMFFGILSMLLFRF
ncbi:geranylgeranylglycerol-phosphate geranylgeranyltransferase [uncultured Polaribacter sp.]|uniref:geranylgeranylglycerol-phosphate geranylgeranyltransferase n=1 Tax=uncultured Polaribacter sp. TaxID=174711 RepID=UPI002608C02B|nr:geranylgeranylglycerol-phosphate geranylgeranyltransferase [uncultured Polaribacter sp.]